MFPNGNVEKDYPTNTLPTFFEPDIEVYFTDDAGIRAKSAPCQTFVAQ
jgi:hypothetical protein